MSEAVMLTGVVGVAGIAVGFLGNIAVMRGWFRTTVDCDRQRQDCDTTREQRWEDLDKRLLVTERCLMELRDGWKENYKKLCVIEAIVNRLEK